MAEMAKEAKIAKQAWNDTYFFGSFCPNKTRMSVLKAGINGISQK
jgi:hypothetical protein